MKINWNFRFNKIFYFFALFLFTAMSASATTLPPYVVDVLKKEVPNATIRFDGLISMPNGVVYLPVIPSDSKKNPTGKIVVTYPSNKKLSQFPDVVLFDSNFALLKVIKNKAGQVSVTDSKNIPFIVKTGIFPQDLLVPPGFVIPEDMKIMLGDLDINVIATDVNATIKVIITYIFSVTNS